MSAELRNLTLLRETDAAIFVETKRQPNRSHIQAWIPKSQLDYRKNYAGCQDIDIRIPEWLAEKIGFNY